MQPTLQCPFLHEASINNDKHKEQIPGLLFPSNDAALTISIPLPPHSVRTILCLNSLLLYYLNVPSSPTASDVTSWEAHTEQYLPSVGKIVLRVGNTNVGGQA